MQSIAHGYKKTALKERSSYSIYSQLTADKHLRRLRNKRQCGSTSIFQHCLYLSPHSQLTDIVKILMPAVCDTAYSAVYKMSRRKLKSGIYISGFFQLLYRIKNVIIFILRYPKGTDFLSVSEKEFQKVIHLINSRPRKCLGYLSPLEFLSKKCCT